MSLAWGGIVLLVLLLPGFLFFVGLYLPERFTRDTTERSALGQLAAVVLVSLVVQGVLFILNRWACPGLVPCVNIEALFGTITLEDANPEARLQLAAGITANALFILLYLLAGAGLGTLAGWYAGSQVVQGRLRFLAQHTWIYDLKVDHEGILTVAYVMSNVKHEDRVLMYRGFLKAFGLRKDGCFAYVILTDVVRYYMYLETAQPRTSEKASWRLIGADPESAGPLQGAATLGRRDRSYFAIEGEDIANVIFDRFPVHLKSSLKDLEKLIKRVQEDFDRTSAALYAVHRPPLSAEEHAPRTTQDSAT